MFDCSVIAPDAVPGKDSVLLAGPPIRFSQRKFGRLMKAAQYRPCPRAVNFTPAGGEQGAGGHSLVDRSAAKTIRKPLTGVAFRSRRRLGRPLAPPFSVVAGMSTGSLAADGWGAWLAQ